MVQAGRRFRRMILVRTAAGGENMYFEKLSSRAKR